MRIIPRLGPSLVALLLLLGWAGRAEAVTVSPTAVYIDHRTRTATLTLHNPDPNPAEVEISFAFGYPQSDATGTITVPLFEPSATDPSAAGWLRAFPRRLILEPGQRQVVRVMVQPPADLADGEYWARVLVSAKGGPPPIEQVQGDKRIQLELRTVLVTALNYRKGAVSTGIAVRAASATASESKVTLTLDLAREGNAAYLGQVRASLVAPNGKVVAEQTEDLAVYREMRRRVELALPAGTRAQGHTVQYTLTSEREDLPPEGPLPTKPISGSVQIR